MVIPRAIVLILRVFLSCKDPSKLMLYSFEPLTSLNDEDSYYEGYVQQQSFSNSWIGNTE